MGISVLVDFNMISFATRGSLRVRILKASLQSVSQGMWAGKLAIIIVCPSEADVPEHIENFPNMYVCSW